MVIMIIIIVVTVIIVMIVIVLGSPSLSKIFGKVQPLPAKAGF